jgi:hypothetical protein
VIEHVPVASIVTTVPATVQTVLGLAVKLTGRPDDAVAFMEGG